MQQETKRSKRLESRNDRKLTFEAPKDKFCSTFENNLLKEMNKTEDNPFKMLEEEPLAFDDDV